MGSLYLFQIVMLGVLLAARFFLAPILFFLIIGTAVFHVTVYK